VGKFFAVGYLEIEVIDEIGRSLVHGFLVFIFFLFGELVEGFREG
jgi:hypothetical protein